MLELKNISKNYTVADTVVHALKNVNIEFRKSEFVSILGPSGCGKTTLLNIVGGLDRYSSGDLIIKGVSTKNFKDKDWDTYRNHSVGFVFQSYNLISHQTILENVELALTLSGVSKKERQKKAIEALKSVGLGDKIHNKPNQLSGGQMQRVAIARAIVNNPEIILADEPTGALDTVTSTQIMKILKKISKRRLVIMVTHNPDLAQKYSTRIIKLLDGEKTNDSKPFSEEDRLQEAKQLKRKNKSVQTKKQKTKKTRMSFFTAFGLSFKNLLTKKGRTALVSIAGSIGIIGIALILSISSGFNSYIDKMQEDALTSYPITIESQGVDFMSIMSSLIENRFNKTTESHPNDGVYSNDSIGAIMDNTGNSISSNNLEAFKKYLDAHYDEIKNSVSGIQYNYNISSKFYSENGKEEISSTSAIMKMIPTYAIYYFQNITHADVNKNANGTVTITKNENYDPSFVERTPAVKAILNDPSKSYNFDTTGTVTIKAADVLSVSLAVVGFTSSGSSGMGSNFGIGLISNSIFNEMIDNEPLIASQYDILAGSLISAQTDKNSDENEAMLVLGQNNEMDDYLLYALGFVSDEQMEANLKSIALEEESRYVLKADYNAILNKKYKVVVDSDYFVDMLSTGVFEDLRDDKVIKKYTSPTLDDDSPNPDYNPALYYSNLANVVNSASNYITIKGIVKLNSTTENGALESGIVYTSEFTKKIINYENSKGCMDEIKLDVPSSIHIYVNSFEAKETIQNFINKYNDNAEDGKKITYTDYVGIIMGTVSTIITSITYVLIAFVSVSLIVSSIMIGVITYISVIERTNEIGILRSIGASKKDVGRVFNAESFIIGLSSGVIGIAISYLLLIPINAILKHFTGIGGIAMLPVPYALILVVISFVLTLIAGFIPSRIAAKKDPVVALRSN